MKYYTLEQLLITKIKDTSISVNCKDIFALFPTKTPQDLISGEELVLTLLESDLRLKGNILWKNNLWMDNISVESVGAFAYDKVCEFLKLRNCDISTMYGCYDCENVSYSGIIVRGVNVMWCDNCKNCENILYSSKLRDSQYVILNKQVGRDEFEDEFGKLQETVSVSTETFNARTAAINAVKQRIRRRYIRG